MKLLTSQVGLVVKDTTRFTSRVDCDQCGRGVRKAGKRCRHKWGEPGQDWHDLTMGIEQGKVHCCEKCGCYRIERNKEGRRIRIYSTPESSIYQVLSIQNSR